MNQTDFLEEKAREIRISLMEMLAHLGSGHVGGCLSIVDVLAVLYFDIMNVDPQNPKIEDRDYLVLSKGHAGPALYATLALKGYFPKKELLTLNQSGTHLPSHCDRQKTIGIDMTTGSLGQGISSAAGMAAGLKLKKSPSRVFCIIGDGESQEGLVWEAGMFAAARGLDNLIVFTDKNKLQIDGATDDVMPLGDLQAKWKAFGWQTWSIDGHNVDEIAAATRSAMDVTGQPSMIILNTIKGKGAPAFEGKAASHHAAVTEEIAREAIENIMAGGR